MTYERHAAPAPPRVRRLTEAEKVRTLRALSACEVAPRAVCERAVEQTRLVPGTPWYGVRGPRDLVAAVALASRADGITLGRQVHLRRALFRRPLSASLIAHEVCHVAQILRDGPARFYLRYLREYAAGLARGLGDREAYLQISYEVQARAAGRAAA